MILDHVKGTGTDCPDFYNEDFCESCIYSDECGILFLEMAESKQKAPRPCKGQRRLEVSGSTVHGTEHLAPSTGAESREHGSSKLRTLRVLRDSDGSPEDDPYQSDLIRQDLHARATAADVIAVRDLDSVSGTMPLCEYDQWLQNIIDGDY